MSVKTTVDEKVDIASITVIEALEALTCVIVGRCWGWDELSRERKQELYEQVYVNHCRIPGLYTDLHCRFQNNNLSIDLNKYYSAYQSIDQVCKMWTEEALEFYRFLGFSLVKIHVKRCIVTDHQCFFRKKDIVRADKCTALN